MRCSESTEVCLWGLLRKRGFTTEYCKEFCVQSIRFPDKFDIASHTLPTAPSEAAWRCARPGVYVVPSWGRGEPFWRSGIAGKFFYTALPAATGHRSTCRAPYTLASARRIAWPAAGSRSTSGRRTPGRPIVTAGEARWSLRANITRAFAAATARAALLGAEGCAALHGRVRSPFWNRCVVHGSDFAKDLGEGHDLLKNLARNLFSENNPVHVPFAAPKEADKGPEGI